MGYNKPTKKSLKESIGEYFAPIETSIFGFDYDGDGDYTVVGPDPYKNRKWYATVSVKGGLITKVK